MNLPSDPIEVTAHFEPQGDITPLRFVWRGDEYPVISTGRRWHDELGQHILVMVPGETVFEIFFDPAAMRWYLIETGYNRHAA